MELAGAHLGYDYSLSVQGTSPALSNYQWKSATPILVYCACADCISCTSRRPLFSWQENPSIPPSLHPSPPPLSSWVAVVVVSSHEDSLGATCVGSGYTSRRPCRVFQGDVCRRWVCMLAAGGCLCVLFCLLSYFSCLCFIIYSFTHLTLVFFLCHLPLYCLFLFLSRPLPLFSLFHTQVLVCYSHSPCCCSLACFSCTLLY